MDEPAGIEFRVGDDTVIVPFCGVSYVRVKAKKSDLGILGCTGFSG